MSDRSCVSVVKTVNRFVASLPLLFVYHTYNRGNLAGAEMRRVRIDDRRDLDGTTEASWYRRLGVSRWRLRVSVSAAPRTVRSDNSRTDISTYRRLHVRRLVHPGGKIPSRGEFEER